MIKQIVKAVTPPVLLWGARKFRKPSPPSTLFDGENALFKSVLRTTQLYGEYGCGASTKWVLANTGAEVRSVDTSKQWVDNVISQIETGNLKRLAIHLVDLGEIGGWGRPTSYERRTDFPRYTDWIWEHTSKPDTVLIDGRFRVCSFLTSLKFADEGARLIFDDYTNRPCYHIVEKFVRREDVCGRQCLFIVPKSGEIDYDDLEAEIRNFRHVMD